MSNRKQHCKHCPKSDSIPEKVAQKSEELGNFIEGGIRGLGADKVMGGIGEFCDNVFDDPEKAGEQAGKFVNGIIKKFY